MKRVFLSLGSNLGDRAGNIRRALDGMAKAGIQVATVSSLYRTEPVEYLQQPWFINCVAEVETDLLPVQLLKALQRLEWEIGRRRSVHKGPRKIDIDILFYENAVVSSPGLNIPHVSMAQRRFVLVPLKEIAPGMRHPVTDRTVSELLNETADTSQVIRLNPAETAAG